MEETHKQQVEAIADKVADYYGRKQPFRIYHGTTNTTRIMSFKRDEMIDVGMLGKVLSVDYVKQTAIVEPNLPMDKLVKAMLKYGLIPPVVMEFPGITVGGGIQGAGGESSSFRWGCFNRIFNWYEMVLANGEIIRASPKEHADLFDGTASSCGTLGIITAAEIQLVPARKYVELTYLPVDSYEAAVKKFEVEIINDHDFIDGVMFGPDHGLVIVGKMVDKPSGYVHRFSRAHDEWFYLHTEKIDRGGQELTESVPLVDYLFRHDRGAFWAGSFAFERFGVPFNRFTRWLLNPILHTRKLYEALQASGASQEYIAQDLGVPLERTAEFMDFVDRELGIRPLWICPLKPDPKSPLQLNGLDVPMVINVGVWGSRYRSYNEFVAANRLIEKRLYELGGKKWFYAYSFYTENEFWSIYDKTWYDRLRKKYHATSLPTVYDKISVTKQVEVSSKRGIRQALFGRAKLPVNK